MLEMSTAAAADNFRSNFSCSLCEALGNLKDDHRSKAIVVGGEGCFETSFLVEISICKMVHHHDGLLGCIYGRFIRLWVDRVM